MHDLESAGFKDIFVGASLWKALGVPSYEFSSNPDKFQKLQTIAKFLNTHPDPIWVIDRLKYNKTNMSGLDFLTSYAQIATKKAEMINQLQEVDAEMKQYETL